MHPGRHSLLLHSAGRFRQAPLHKQRNSFFRRAVAPMSFHNKRAAVIQPSPRLELASARSSRTAEIARQERKDFLRQDAIQRLQIRIEIGVAKNLDGFLVCVFGPELRVDDNKARRFHSCSLGNSRCNLYGLHEGELLFSFSLRFAVNRIPYYSEAIYYSMAECTMPIALLRHRSGWKRSQFPSMERACSPFSIFFLFLAGC
jgi:hypothetical protein